jgi:hypothetical protein
MRDERGYWYLLTGFVIGIVLGLVYAWLIAPQQYKDTSPASLQPEFKDQYRAMIAAAFVANGNLARAEARLKLLGDQDVVRTLSEQAQLTLAEGSDPRTAQALGLLAVALGQGESATVPSPVPTELPTDDLISPSPPSPTFTLPIPTETVEPTAPSTQASPNPNQTDQTPQITRTVLSTATPLATRTPTITPGSPFVLQENTFVCDREISGPLIQVMAENSRGRQIAGEQIVASWEGGEDHFFTGLKPELGRGYADFLMTPGVIYEVSMSGGGQTVSDLTPAECETQAGGRYWGSWLLVFSQP